MQRLFPACWLFGLGLTFTTEVRPELTGVQVAAINSVVSETVAPGSSGNGVIRAQILLDRAHFSPGQIDGRYNPNLRIAITGYQRSRKLPATGTIDRATWQQLNADPETPLMPYVVRNEDLKGPFLPSPASMNQMARMQWLGFDSPEQELGEVFHINGQLLKKLNPQASLRRPGERIFVPRVQRNTQRVASKIVVSRAAGTVTAISVRGAVMAQYPATVGSRQDPFTAGEFAVSEVEFSPVFYFNPARFWNGTSLGAAAKVAPGPKNPAGAVWIGLTKLHYGIHGTPWPERIGAAEEKGCIRMTNWDAMDLSSSVYRGLPVIFTDEPFTE